MNHLDENHTLIIHFKESFIFRIQLGKYCIDPIVNRLTTKPSKHHTNETLYEPPPSQNQVRSFLVYMYSTEYVRTVVNKMTSTNDSQHLNETKIPSVKTSKYLYKQ